MSNKPAFEYKKSRHYVRKDMKNFTPQILGVLFKEKSFIFVPVLMKLYLPSQFIHTNVLYFFNKSPSIQ